MKLYADRTFSIDTENAFKIGPHIDVVENNKIQRRGGNLHKFAWEFEHIDVVERE